MILYKDVVDFFSKNDISLETLISKQDFDIFSTTPLEQYIQEILDKNFKKEVSLFIPGRGFRSLSVTGSSCDLHCEHCDNKYLEIMADVSTESKLRSVLDKLISDKQQGCLISGGCDTHGKVPFLKYYDVLAEYREKSDLIFNYHIGLLDDAEIKKLAELKPHFVSFDFTVDDDIIQNIYHHKERTSEDYIRVLESLIEHKINVVPHITVGLNYGNVNQEYHALEILKKYDFDLLVFIVIIPPPDDARFSVPDSNTIQNVFKLSRFLFPNVELSLGCMRPRGKKFLYIEEAAVEAGFNRYVIPSKKTVKNLSELGCKIKNYDACCAIPLKFYK